MLLHKALKCLRHLIKQFYRRLVGPAPSHMRPFVTFIQWEKYFSKQGPEMIAMIQAALIGQTFGLLSGVRRLWSLNSFNG